LGWAAEEALEQPGRTGPCGNENIAGDLAGRDLSGCDYVYVWADGVHLKVRLDEAKACVLVLLGVRADGRKELIALDAGYRESGESWANLLRDCALRGMRAPVLAVGDGALGFWKALREVFFFPATRAQRCWVHKTANVIDALPKSAQPAAKAALAESGAPRTRTAPRPRSPRSPSSTARSSPRQWPS
jgi:transposase-like protein